MDRLPMLKLKMPNGSEEIHKFEEAKILFDDWAIDGMLVLIEKRVVRSYEELVQMATRDGYNDKEFLEVEMLPFIDGG